MKATYLLAILAITGGICSCNADMDVEIAAPLINEPDLKSIQGSLVGDDYVLTWPQTTNKMQVTTLINGNKTSNTIVEGNSYTTKNMDTNQEFTFILKYTDGNNFSKGVTTSYMRKGANKCSDLEMSQVEKTDGYDLLITWKNSSNATYLHLFIDNGAGFSLNLDTDTKQSSFTMPDVHEGETWTVKIVAENAEGTSLPISSSLRIGKLAVAYLSMYDTEEELLANGDDDEAYGWVWFHNNYPNGKFLPFSEISSATVLEPYRVIFFMRDIDDPKGDNDAALKYPEVVNNATPFISEWYKAGGNILLWSHATTYIAHLGRISLDMMKKNGKVFGYGCGNNPDTWKMAVELSPGDGKFYKDHSNHPIFKGLDIENRADGKTKLLPVKSGSAFTEDHNCLFYDFPSTLTGLGNQEETCYDVVTKTWGICPIGTWDNDQINYVSQLNVWEAQPGNSEFMGTAICVGNGGCNFYLRTQENFDVTKQPSGNGYQGNIETMAKNAIEYLKTR